MLTGINGFFCKSVIIFLIVLCAALLPGYSQEDSLMSKSLLEMNLEGLLGISVQSSGFFKVSAQKAPSYNYIFHTADMARKPVRNLEQVIDALVPGMSVGQHSLTGSIIGSRGILIDASSKTMVMLEGQNLNLRSHHGYMMGLPLPLLADLDRIEFVLGPGANVHGSGALNGIVNMIMKDGLKNNGPTVSAEYGPTEGVWKTELGYGLTYGNDKNLFLYGGAYDIRGIHYDSTYLKLVPASDTTVLLGHSIKPSRGTGPVCYKVSANWNHGPLNVRFLFFDVNENRFDHMNDPLNRTQAMLTLNPKYTHKISEKSHMELSGQLNLSDQYYFSPVQAPGGLGGSEALAGAKVIFRTLTIDKHAVAIGYQIGYRKFREAETYFHKKLQGGWDAANTSWMENALFIEDQIELTPATILNVGARVDHYTMEKMDYILHLSPSVSLYQQISRSLSLRGSYRHGFRTPDAYLEARKTSDFETLKKALYPALPAQEFPQLLSEKMDNIELNLGYISNDKTLSANLNIFFNYNQHTQSFQLFAENYKYLPNPLVDSVGVHAALNYITPSQSWWGTFVNLAEPFYTIGNELVVIYMPSPSSRVEASYSFCQSFFENSRQKTLRYPIHQLKTHALHTFANRMLTASVIFTYRPPWDYAIYNVNPIFGKAINKLDAMLTINAWQKLKISLSAQNLLRETTPNSSWSWGMPWKWANGLNERFYYLQVHYNL